MLTEIIVESQYVPITLLLHVPQKEEKIGCESQNCNLIKFPWDNQPNEQTNKNFVNCPYSLFIFESKSLFCVLVEQMNRWCLHLKESQYGFYTKQLHYDKEIPSFSKKKFFGLKTSFESHQTLLLNGVVLFYLLYSLPMYLNPHHTSPSFLVDVYLPFHAIFPRNKAVNTFNFCG